MSDIVNLLKNVGSVNVSPQFDMFTQVVVNVSDSESYVAGTETGRVLELTNPLFGSQVPEKLLARLQSNRLMYQPFTMEGAMLNPAAEIGDAVSANEVYGGIYNRDRDFGVLMRANIEAPSDEEIDHEYKFESKQQREYKRQIGEVRATLLLQEASIQAKVSKTSPEGNTDFGWELGDSSWKIFSEDEDLFYVDYLGGTFSGSVNAETGKIGDFTIGYSYGALNVTASEGLTVEVNNTVWVSANGGRMANTSKQRVFTYTQGGWTFKSRAVDLADYGITVTGSPEVGDTIRVSRPVTASAIYSEIESFDAETATSGIYLGTNGIRLGKNFKVDSSGDATANNMTLTGTLKFGDKKTITAANLHTGATEAYNGYGGWNNTKTGWDNAISASGSVGRFRAGELHVLNKLYVVSSNSTLEVAGSGSMTFGQVMAKLRS